MDHASIINFLSNEDTQELAPGFFMKTIIIQAAAKNLKQFFWHNALRLNNYAQTTKREDIKFGALGG
jgi:hypothetical protein